MEDLLKVLQRVTSRLSSLSIQQLVKVCDHLKIEAGDVAETPKDHLRLVRKLLTYINSNEVEDSEDGGVELLENLDSFISESIIESIITEPLALEEPAATNPMTNPDSSTKQKTPTTTTNQPPTTPTEMAHLLRREFKVSGQIGEPGQRDRLTFTSLANQIEVGLEKGYPDRDIVQGVIRAIVPGSSLRSYLEGRRKISLPSLRRIVQSHYQEKDATDLYKQMSQLTQEDKESAQSFLLRAFDIRQKVLFASEEADSQLHYDPNLVREMFRHSILTGLRSDSIKAELRPYLDNPDTTDEILFEKMNVYSSLEAERHRKPHPTRPVGASEVREVDRQQPPPPKPGLLMTEIAELKAGITDLSSLKNQVASLQESLQKTKQSTPWDNRSTPRLRRGCQKCQDEGVGSTCDHCFKCGLSDHFARGCRRGRGSSNQGNAHGTGSNQSQPQVPDTTFSVSFANS